MQVNRYFIFLIALFCSTAVFGQKDMDLHLSHSFLAGKNVLKVKRDFKDPYLWVLTKNNQVYRINSVTMVLDDYSSYFSSFNNLTFIDIAGVSGDQVYVAANSANLIEYKNGAVKQIGVVDGVRGNINSIGVDYTNNYMTNGGPRINKKNLIVATDNGRCHYDYENGVMFPDFAPQPSRIFEATYRAEMFSNLEFGFGDLTDDVKHYPVIELTGFTIYNSFLWHGVNDIGNNINTAFYLTGDLYTDAYLSFNSFYKMVQVWGTEKGLFANNRGYSYWSGWGYKKFLADKNITKVTSIFGLRAFGEGMLREHLMVGTTEGFYYSTSGYNHYFNANMPDYQFFKYTPLGNVSINDVCVNATSYQQPICEDGVWVAAANGLFFLRPDYSPYANQATTIDGIEFNGANAQQTELQFCGAISTKINVKQYAYNGNSIRWYKDGVEIPGESATTLNVTQTGSYNAIFYDPCTNVNFKTNTLKVTELAAPVFTFNYPDKLAYCSGTTAILKTEANVNYKYRWYKNGILQSETTSQINITQNGKYKLEVSACENGWVASKEVEVAFIKTPSPTISADKASFCNGETALLKSNIALNTDNIIGWQPYTYRWYKDDGLILGANGSTYGAVSSGRYRVEATSCSGNNALSAEYVLTFTDIPSLSIAADKAGYCTGDQAVLSLNFTGTTNYEINWMRDGVVMSEHVGKRSINTSTSGAYEVMVKNIVTLCSRVSSVYNVTFGSLPSINIERVVNTTLCDGQTVDLKANYSGGTVKWSTGVTANTISINQSGTYTAIVSTPGGCAVSETITVDLFPNPVLNLPNETLCQFDNEEVTLTAPAGFVSYAWNGQIGNNLYTTNKLGLVTLTVVDQNGCVATQTVNVTSKCKDIYFPNTFTPNGDGINDKWLITGLEGDPTVKVRVFSRGGEMVFQSIGYTQPWDGHYKGKVLPSGSYYYIINAKSSAGNLSGTVTIVR